MQRLSVPGRRSFGTLRVRETDSGTLSTRKLNQSQPLAHLLKDGFKHLERLPISSVLRLPLRRVELSSKKEAIVALDG